MGAKVIQFAGFGRRLQMGAANPQGEIQPQAQQPAPVPQPAFAAAAQVQPYIPANVWTPEAVIHFHDRQQELLIDNNRLVENQRGREYTLSLVVLAGFGAIVAVGFLFTYW